MGHKALYKELLNSTLLLGGLQSEKAATNKTEIRVPMPQYNPIYKMKKHHIHKKQVADQIWTTKHSC